MSQPDRSIEDYVSLKEASDAMGIAYSTAHAYAVRDCLPGAVLWNGTRWYVHKRTIKAFKNGDLSIKGAFREKD